MISAGSGSLATPRAPGDITKGKGKAPSTMPEASITSELVSEPVDNSLLCNLLPGGSVTKDTTGIYVGEGLLPVHVKLAEKIT